VKARRERRSDLPAECEAQITAAASGMVTPGLEGLAGEWAHDALGPHPSRPIDPGVTEKADRARRGRRAPAIPMPVDEPPKKRGRR
jgi:hypothetical protein